MNEILLPNERHVNLFKWKDNPFNFKIIPELFVGYEKEINEIINSLQSGNKFSLVLGPTGSGKTTFLKFLFKKFSGIKYVSYLPKPPDKPEDWITIFTKILRPGFFHRLFSRSSQSNNITLYELSEWMNNKLKNNKFILLIDECHEANLNSLQWLRTLTDHIDNLSLVLAGLPIFENMLKEKLETFLKRVNTRVELTNLTNTEIRELIKKRIEYVGGEDVKPFTSNSIQFIYEKTAGFPREVLRICNDLVQHAIEKNMSTVDIEFLRESKESRIKIQKTTELPYRQKTILEILAKYKELTPAEIVSNIELKEYKNRANAVRSINNILRRLMKENMIIRERKGKTYIYKISSNFQTLMVNA